jgi:hypothetical protein
VGQGFGVSQSVHPEGITLQRETPLPEHCFAPAVHWSVQFLTHWPPEQIWPVGQGTGASQSVQPEAIFLQVATPEPEHCLAPSVH